MADRPGRLGTGVGFGVAIPHGRAAGVVGPEAGAGEHNRALARIARIIRQGALRERFMDCHTPDEFHRTSSQAEAE